MQHGVVGHRPDAHTERRAVHAATDHHESGVGGAARYDSGRTGEFDRVGDRDLRVLMARLRQNQEPEPEPDALPGLTARKQEILALIGEDMTNRQIGRRRHLAGKTVKNHISRLLAELGVERRIQAAVIATQTQDRPRHEAQ
ncbi:hypothetical protein GCM10010365_45950 [Streptomyces poonensis]|uniref:HTH luxR-type domain-containing protein n=1 Tax=Streptomyces poonensis TaxID=68255 RepID=A0A918UMG5_9ACTN|nr:hypothetical protein GCM10010365_45950 [Streptomyces poonensis]